LGGQRKADNLYYGVLFELGRGQQLKDQTRAEDVKSDPGNGARVQLDGFRKKQSQTSGDQNGEDVGAEQWE
jgi:hypothetical protein